MEAPARTDAPDPVVEEQLLALRDEIRRAVRVTPDLMGTFTVYAFCGIAVAVAIGALISHLFGGRDWTGVVVGGVAGLAYPLALHRIGRYLRQRTLQLAPDFRQLPRESAEKLLAELSMSQDRRIEWLAGDLRRELGLPTELAPAAAPDGSGAEVSGIGRAQGDQQA